MASSWSTNTEPATIRRLNDFLYEFYRPATEAVSLDILFFHGFEGRGGQDAYRSTWMLADESASWLQTWLSESFPQSRILSVSYDAVLDATSGTTDKYLIAESLSFGIIHLGKVGQACPVILVGHDVGGMVLQEVCVHAERQVKDFKSKEYNVFLKALRGIFFFSSSANFMRHPPQERLSQNSPRSLSDQFMYILTSESPRSNSEFASMRRKYGWKTFAVIGAAPKQSVLRRSRKEVSQRVVEETYDVDEFCILPGVDNTTLCKPKDRTSSSFQILVSFVQGILALEEEANQAWHRLLKFPDVYVAMPHRVDNFLRIHPTKSRQHLGKIALVGCGGVGKTTLAKEVLLKIRSQFNFVCFVEDVKGRLECQDLYTLLADNFYDSNGKKVPVIAQDGDTASVLLQSREKVLLVLDNVDSEEQISPLWLKDGWTAADSLLIITSSGLSPEFRSSFLIYEVPNLSAEESRRLFSGHLDLEVVGKIPSDLLVEVLESCNGLAADLARIGKDLQHQTSIDVWRAALATLRQGEFPKEGYSGLRGVLSLHETLEVDYGAFPWRRAFPKEFYRGRTLRRANTLLLRSRRMNVADDDNTDLLCSDSASDGQVPPETLNATLRPDLVALGFRSFSTPFDPSKIVCMYMRDDAQEDFVKLLFLHPQGMAQLVGVGIPFCKVLLYEDRDVEVTEIEQAVWKQSWMASSMKNYALLVFHPGNTTQKGSRSTELVDMTRSANSGQTQVMTTTEWIRSIFKMLRSANDTLKMAKGVESGGDAEGRGEASCSATFKGKPHVQEIGSEDKTPKDSPVTAADDHSPWPKDGRNAKELRLTTRVDLRSATRKLKRPVRTESNQIHKTKIPDMLLSCVLGNTAVPDEDESSCSAIVLEERLYQLDALVVIEFSSKAYQSGTYGSKRFSSTLEVDFNMPQENGTPSQKDFGWYQDKLLVSFKCAADGAAERRTKEINEEVESPHELREVQRIVDTERTKTIGKVKSGMMHVALIPLQMAQLGFGCGCNKEVTAAKVEKSQVPKPMKFAMLEHKNFMICKRGDKHELAYCFQHSPPRSSFDFWHSHGDRKQLSYSVMNPVTLRVKAEWTVKDDIEAIRIEGGLCSYELLCQRNLVYLHQKTQPPSKSAETNENEIEYPEDQKMSKLFYINHSFSHMHRLRKPVEDVIDVQDDSGTSHHIRAICR